MSKWLFPELEKKTGMSDLIGLKVTKVITDLQDGVKSIHLEDDRGELHILTFPEIEPSYVAIELDEKEICHLYYPQSLEFSGRGPR